MNPCDAYALSIGHMSSVVQHALQMTNAVYENYLFIVAVAQIHIGGQYDPICIF